MATRVAADLRTVIESRYSHASYIPADDTTLTAENFARFDRDKVVAWLPHDTVHHGLLPNPLTFVMQEKMSGADILPLDLKALEDHFNTKFHGEALVSALHQEMTFVRIKFRDAFSQKTVEDVLVWAKSKPNEIAMSAALLQATGAQLLEMTSFPMAYSELCKDCKLVMDRGDMCPVNRLPHPVGSNMHTYDTQQCMAKIANTMRAQFSVYLAKLHKSLSTIPQATFRHGLYWYKVQRQAGYMALLLFRLTELRIRDPLVVLRSTLSLRVGSSGGISNFRIVAAPDSGEGLFHAFTGMVATPTPTTRRFHTEDTLLPHGWKRTIVKGHGGHLEGVYYSPEEVRHPTHPTMPMAHAAEFSEADGHQAVAMAYAPGDTMITPTTTPPQPQHFFSAPSHTSDRSYHVADVSMHSLRF